MAEILPLDWNRRLRWERERRGWTRAQLAEQLKAGVHSIYRWEEKGDTPRAEVLQALIDLFGKPVEAWGKRIWRLPYLRNLYFTGRERILERLHAFLNGPVLREHERFPVAVSQTRAISGLGGIGKTQTAVEYAYRFGHEYDLVCLVRASSREVLVAELAGLAILLGLPCAPETTQEHLAHAVKRRLETEQEQVWLLIFDNVEDLRLVKEFLPAKGNGAILLTTRLQAVGKHIRKLELDTLTLEESTQFFQARVGSDEEPGQKVLASSERQAAAQLHTLLGGLPLALEQAAAYIETRGCSLADYVTRYQQQRAALLQLPNQVDQEDYPDSVATTWLLSFRQVEEANADAVHLLRLLAFLHPDAIPKEALQAVVEGSTHLQAAIEILQNYSLIQHQPKAGTLTIHRLVQAVIQDGMEDSERHAWSVRAMLAVNAAFPRVAPETWSQCERLLTQALHVTQVIEQHPVGGEEADRLLFETASYLQYRGRYAEAQSLYLRALHLREQQWGETHPAVATALAALGWLYREQGQFAEAESLCQRALGIWEQQGEPEYAQVASALNSLAVICTSRGQFAEAEPLYLRELAICEQHLGPSHDDTARTLNNLGNLYAFQGRYLEAEPVYLRALHIWEQQLGPENSRLAYPLHGLGALYHYQGRYAESEPCYLRALSIREQQLGLEHSQVAYLLTGLANFYCDQGRYGEAESRYLRALRIWEEQGGETHPESSGALIGLATLSARQSKHAEAESLFHRVLRLYEQQGLPEHYLVASVLNGLANLCREQGRYEDAEPLYQRALDIREKTWGAEHPDTAETLHELGRLREAQGNTEEARSWYQRALAAREQAFGAQHPKTSETRQRLSTLFHAMGWQEEANQ